MLAVAHLHDEAQLGGGLLRVFVHGDVGDVAVVLADGGRHAGEHAFGVLHDHAQAGFERPGAFFRPAQIDPAVRVFLEQAPCDVAVLLMHDQAFALAQIADDGVARNGTAAGGVAHRDAFAAVKLQRGLGVVSGTAFQTLDGVEQGRGQRVLRGDERHHALGQNVGHALAQADVGVQIVARLEARPAQQFVPHGVVEREQIEMLVPQRALQQTTAQFDRLGLLRGAQRVPNLGTRPPGAHKAQPARIGARGRRGDDFHHIAAAQLGAQGHERVVHLGRHRLVAQIGVNGIGKIDRRGAARQRQNARLGREHIDRVGRQIDLDGFEKIGPVAVLGLDVQ